MAKFPWGDKATDDRVMFAAIVYQGIVTSLAMTNMGESGPASEGAGISLSNPGVRNCVLASLIWVLMIFNSMGLQVFLRLGAKNFSKGANSGARRVVYNSLEWAPQFFVLMWLHCIFVDSAQAGVLGFVYVFHRILYGVFFSAMGQFTFLCEFCTQPGYTVLYFFLFSLVTACLPEYFSPLITYLPTNPFILAAFLSFINLVLFTLLFGFPTGFLMMQLMNKAHPFDENSEIDPDYGHLNESKPHKE